MSPYRSENRVDLVKDFPQIEDVIGTVKIKPSYGGTKEELYPFTMANLPTEYVACESPVCNDGGVYQTDIFRELLGSNGQRSEGRWLSW